MCVTPSWRLESLPLPPTPHKYLYLWNDHRTNGARWFLLSLYIIEPFFSFLIKEKYEKLQIMVEPGVQFREGKD